MIDPMVEKTLTLAQAARRIRPLRGDKPVSPITIRRWSKWGIRGVRLDVVRVGGTLVTSEEALQRFFAALNDQPVNPATVARQKDEHDAAVEAELDRRLRSRTHVIGSACMG